MLKSINFTTTVSYLARRATARHAAHARSGVRRGRADIDTAHVSTRTATTRCANRGFCAGCSIQGGAATASAGLLRRAAARHAVHAHSGVRRAQPDLGTTHCYTHMARVGCTNCTCPAGWQNCDLASRRTRPITPARGTPGDARSLQCVLDTAPRRTTPSCTITGGTR